MKQLAGFSVCRIMGGGVWSWCVPRGPLRAGESLCFLLNIALFLVGMPEMECCSPTVVFCPGSWPGFPLAVDTGGSLRVWPSWTWAGDVAEPVVHGSLGCKNRFDFSHSFQWSCSPVLKAQSLSRLWSLSQLLRGSFHHPTAHPVLSHPIHHR